jgi:hypothetical protein
MKSLRFFAHLSLFLALTISLSMPAKAQFRSSIEGTVTDPSGAVVPEAQVVLTNTATGISTTAPSNGGGLFRFPALPPGRYKLTATKKGFATTSQENIELLAEEIRTVPLALKAGEITETVTVTGEAAPIQLSEAKIASDISARELSQLPLAGRNFGNLILQTPGVTGIGNASGNANDTDIFSLVNNPQVNGGGQRGDGNAFYLDNTLATSNPDPGVFNLTPNPDSIEELHVSVNDYSAEYGRSGGLVIQAISKTGTNQFHGSLFEYHQDNKLYAHNTFAKDVPVFRRNEFGGSVGGPILKNKLFGFFSWDQKRASSPTVLSNNIETPDFVAFMKTNFPNNLSTQLLTKYPASGGAITNIQTVNDIEGTDPNTGQFLCVQNGAPVPGMPCTLPIRERTNVGVANRDNGLQWNSRVDVSFSKDRFYGNFYRKTPDVLSPNARPAFNTPNNFAGITNYGNLDWTHTFSPTIVNDAAMGITRISGLGSCVLCQVPPINIGGGFAGFGGGFAPAEFIQNDFQWRDLLSVNHGRHAMKFGADIFRDQENDLFDGPTQRPGYGFAPNPLTGNLPSIFNFANDQPTTQGAINYDLRSGALSQQSVGYRTSNFGFFGQDDWKIKPNLSVNFGLRWDFNTSPNEVAGRTANVILGSGSTFQEKIANASVGLVKSLTPNHGIVYFAPRLSFAWDPTKQGKLSIRGGLGVFYNRAPNIFWSDATRANPPLIGNITADASRPSQPQPNYGLCALDKNPFNCPLPPASELPVGLNARGGALNNSSGIGGVDQATKQAYTISRFIGAQYAVTPNWVVEADYNGSQSVHLYVRTERNRCVGCFDPVFGNSIPLNPFFLGGISYGDNSGWAHSNAVAFSVLHRFSRSFSFQAAYTMSKTTSVVDAPGLGRDSLLSPVFDAYNINAQRGPASFDIPRAFTVHGIWELPKLANQNRLVRGALGGWQWSGSASFQGGYPYSVVDCGHSPDGGSSCVLPDVASGVKDRTCGRSAWRDTGCIAASSFTLPCDVTQLPTGDPNNPLGPGLLRCGSGPWEGAAGRNSFRGPGYANVDFSTAKNFHIPWFVGKEGARLQIRGEFFNLFNRTNLNGVTNLDPQRLDLAFTTTSGLAKGTSGQSTNSTFGLATGAFNPRQLEVGARIEF